jgi:hypothetical protein
MVIDSSGDFGINAQSPAAVLDIRGVGNKTLSGIIPIASISGKTSFAGLVVDNAGRGDLITASSAGLTKFVINNNGNLQFTGNSTFLNTFTTASLTSARTYTLPDATGTICLSTNNCGFALGNYFQRNTDGTSSYNVISPATIADTVSLGVTTPALHFSSFYVEPGSNSKGNSLVAFNQTGNGDIFTASKSGSTKFVIDKNGNVGIGTNLPSQLLTLSSNDVNFTGVKYINTSGSYDQWGVGVYGTNNGGGSFAIHDDTAGYTRMFVDTNGNVGFGDSTYIGFANASPSHSGTTTNDLNYSLYGSVDGGETAINGPGDGITGGVITFKSDNNEYMRMDANGNLGIGTDTPTQKLQVEGNVLIGQQPNTAGTADNSWTAVSNATGQLASGGTTTIASISAMAVYNGSLYAGTTKANGAEVYRYNGTSGNWTRVTNAAGQITSGGTTNIASVSAMAVFNGKLYIGTSKIGGAEVYRYEGGTTWTAVSGGTPGTMGGSSGQTAINGISSMVVYGGQLILGTSKPTKAELYRYDGNNNFTHIDPPAGNVCGPSSAEDAVTAMAVYNNALFIGASAGNLSDFCRMKNSNNTVEIVTSIGTFDDSLTGGTVTVGKITSMVVFNGRLAIGYRTAPSSGGLLFYDSTASDDSNNFISVDSPAGTIGNSSSLAAVSSLAVYNGKLYVGTEKTNAADIYRYVEGQNTGSVWTKVSQATSGTIASGGTTNIDMVANMIQYNGNLYAGTYESGRAEVYSYNVVSDQSYALQFHAGGVEDGGEQNSLLNTGSISFVASPSGQVNTTINGSGAFLFDHTIITNTGAYDYAEDYPTRDDSLSPGDIVALDENENGMVKKAGTSEDSMIGIYSTNPGFDLSQKDGTINGARAVPVALTGRVPVKVSTESGAIKIGDMLTVSSTPGVAMKATKPGFVVGRAMETYNGDSIGQVMAFVDTTWYTPSLRINANGNLSLNDMTLANDDTPLSFPVSNTTDNQINNTAGVSAKPPLTLAELTTNLTTLTSTVSAITTQNASMSAKLDQLTNKFVDLQNLMSGIASNSAFPLDTNDTRGTLDTLSSDVALSGNLSVLGRSTFSDVGITGKLSMGLLTIDGLDTNCSDNQTASSSAQTDCTAATVNTTAGPLKFQSLGLNGVDFENGNVVIDTQGNINVKAQITAKKYNVDTSDVLSASLGTGTLAQNTTKIVIQTTAVTSKSRIFLTPTTKTGQPLSVTAQNDGKSFTVEINQPADEDIKFNWWIVN